MTDADEITEAAVDLLVEYQDGMGYYAMCVCDRWIHRTDWRTHAATCAELRAEAVQRV